MRCNFYFPCQGQHIWLIIGGNRRETDIAVICFLSLPICETTAAHLARTPRRISHVIVFITLRTLKFLPFECCSVLRAGAVAPWSSDLLLKTDVWNGYSRMLMWLSKRVGRGRCRPALPPSGHCCRLVQIALNKLANLRGKNYLTIFCKGTSRPSAKHRGFWE